MLTGEFLRDSAQRFPERVALVDGGRRMSYGELDAYANRFAHALLKMKKENRRRLITDMAFLSQKKGRRFGPFGKLY